MKKETEIKMKAKKYDLLWVFLIVLIPRLICIALFSSPMRTPMDEEHCQQVHILVEKTGQH